MEENGAWKPPTDAVVETKEAVWTPPSDAIPDNQKKTNVQSATTSQDSAEPVQQPISPSIQNGEPINLPAEYETTNPATYKNLVQGQRYNLKRGGVPVTGIWDAQAQEFVKDPLFNFTPQDKRKGIVQQGIEAVAGGDISSTKPETEEEIIGST